MLALAWVLPGTRSPKKLLSLRLLATDPRPSTAHCVLLALKVLVETFEPGESVAKFLKRNGERSISCWRRLDDGRWVMEGAEGVGWEDNDDNAMRSSIALCGVQSCTLRAAAIALTVSDACGVGACCAEVLSRRMLLRRT